MKKTKLPSIVSILILTLITTITWVGFDIYWAIRKTDNPVVSSAVSNPLDPTLDVSTINNIESRPFVNASDIPDTVANQNTNSSSATVGAK
jgi:hypothetical protein